MNSRLPARRIVVFTGRGVAFSTIECVEAIAERHPQWQILILQQCPPRRWGRYLRNKLRRLAREPVSYPLELLSQAAGGRRCATRRSVTRGVRLPRDYDEIRAENVSYCRCARFAAPDMLEKLTAWRPWLGIALAAPLLKPGVFRVPELGTINVHKSLLPDYRGMPPGFWELHDGAAQTGVTVHQIAEGLDTGPILRQRATLIPRYATTDGLAARLDELGQEILLETLADIEPGETSAAPQASALTVPPTRGDHRGVGLITRQDSDPPPTPPWQGGGCSPGTCPQASALTVPPIRGDHRGVAPIACQDSGPPPTPPWQGGECSARPNRRPTWLVHQALRRRLLWRRRDGRVRWLHNVLKHAALGAYVFGWAPLRNAWRRARGRCHTTVLLYHRVSDEFLDPVTVGVEQFKRQLETLRRHYDVMDLPTFLAGRGQARKRPAIVITFDDGYADNHLAARLLRRAGLPATFFISTRIVGGERPFAHDVEKFDCAAPALRWEQVRQMARWGFRFGNHTAEHVNLGTLPKTEAVRQIETASRDLQHHLTSGRVVSALAYPFGKRTDITSEIRGRLESIGIDACLSAYGGVNPPDFDHLDIRRQGIDHNFTPLAFRAALEGWQTRAVSKTCGV